MATTTLTVLDGKVLNRLGTASSDTRLTQTVRFEAINEALQQICLEHDWPWLLTSETITTVAGTSSYSLASDFVRSKSFVETATGLELAQLSTVESDQIIFRGRPSIYTLAGSSVLLKPIPEGVYSILHRYYKVEPVLTTGAGIPLVPLLYSRGVVEFAAMLLAKEIRETDRALEAERDYGSWLKRAQDNIHQSREPLRIRIRRGSWL